MKQFSASRAVKAAPALRTLPPQNTRSERVSCTSLGARGEAGRREAEGMNENREESN